VLHYTELSRAQVIEAAVEALTDAADEDRATGGIDVVRGIFPTVKIATVGGVEDVKDDELRRVYETIIARRRAAE
jgi:proteasome beta subunit